MVHESVPDAGSRNTTAVFVLGLVGVIVLPPAGIALLLWIGLGKKSQSNAINYAAMTIGILALVLLVVGVYVAIAIFDALSEIDTKHIGRML